MARFCTADEISQNGGKKHFPKEGNKKYISMGIVGVEEIKALPLVNILH